jgi:hypothetical protein
MLSEGRNRRSNWPLILLLLTCVAWLACVGAFVTVWVVVGWLT